MILWSLWNVYCDTISHYLSCLHRENAWSGWERLRSTRHGLEDWNGILDETGREDLSSWWCSCSSPPLNHHLMLDCEHMAHDSNSPSWWDDRLSAAKGRRMLESKIISPHTKCRKTTSTAAFILMPCSPVINISLNWSDHKWTAEMHSRVHLAFLMCLQWPLLIGFHASFPLEEGCLTFVSLPLSLVFRQKCPVNPISFTVYRLF